MTEPEKEGAADTLMPVIGVLALAFVMIFLLSTPGMIVAKSITTRLAPSSRMHREMIRLFGHSLMDFGDAEHIDAFPRHIGDWKSMHFNTSRLEEALRADAMLLRVYANPPIPRTNSSSEPAPVSFAIIQSNNVSAFHAPVVCYSGMGYKVEEEATEEVPVHNVSWAAGRWRSERDVTFNGTISAKKLVLFKESEDGTVTDQEIILYFYVKGNPFSTGSITIIRAAAHAPINGSASEDDRIINSTKNFMGDAFPCMFEV